MKKPIVLTAIVCCSVLLGLAVLVWTALSQEALPPAANSCLSIPPTAFRPAESGYTYTSSLSLYTSTPQATFQMPLLLPNGSILRKIRMECKDNSSVSDLRLRLYRYYDGGWSQSAIVKTSGNDEARRVFSTKAISPKVIRNFENAYLLSIYFPMTGTTEFAVYNVKVLYDAP